MKHFTMIYLMCICLFAFNNHVKAQDLLKPTGHFKVEEPADLSIEEAENIYNSITQQMADGYAQSDNNTAGEYQNWQRFNTTPYLSAGHGNRFLNNYGNAKARGYLNLVEDQKLPEGAVIAKDSFTVTEVGEIFPGALFIMEKLASGASAETGDWRYVMIMPDGSLLGDTAGDNPEAMEFCHSCHEIVEEMDYLYLIPDAFRQPPAQ